MHGRLKTLCWNNKHQLQSTDSKAGVYPLARDLLLIDEQFIGKRHVVVRVQHSSSRWILVRLHAWNAIFGLLLRQVLKHEWKLRRTILRWKCGIYQVIASHVNINSQLDTRLGMDHEFKLPLVWSKTRRWYEEPGTCVCTYSMTLLSFQNSQFYCGHVALVFPTALVVINNAQKSLVSAVDRKLNDSKPLH